jgi:trehalose 6-phosphate phosphatase
MGAILGGVSVAEALEETIAPLRADPARAAVLLDVDGTLAPIVRHADDAHVPEATRTPLIAIAKRYGLVACVSGRQAAIARRIVALGTISYVGNHGAELLRGGATTVELDADMQAWEPRVRAFAHAVTTEELHRLRVRSEDKHAISAFHWRGAPDEEAAESAVRDIAAAAEADGFLTHWGRKVLEIRPPVEMHKGKGIERLLGDFGDVRVALYAGDDRTDLDAFRTLRELVATGRLDRAVCVGVDDAESPDEIRTEADVLVDGTGGVRELLRALAA